MKRYIVPLAFIVIGLLLVTYCAGVLRQPNHTFTGMVMCEPMDSDNCDWDGGKNRVNSTEENILVAGEALGILLVPSGIAIGIYRFVRQSRVTRKSTKR